jgi:Ca2+-binding RTX toxin-like protein
MAEVSNFHQFGSLALAAYSRLPKGISRSDFAIALRNTGGDFAVAQADQFVSQFSVVDQYSNPSSGLSVTVFKGSGEARYLAIRGTDDFLDVVTDVISIGLIGSNFFQRQYAELKSKVESWISEGVLGPQFTVTGHSLGGFLSIGIAADFASNVSKAYLFNAPGVGGVSSIPPFGLLRTVASAFGSIQNVDPAKIVNIKADSGISPIAGFGTQVAPVVPVLIEDQLRTDIPVRPAALNHSQNVLADALSIGSLFARLDPSLDIRAVNRIIGASGFSNGQRLESALDSIREIFRQFPKTESNDREALHSDRVALETAIDQSGFAGQFRVIEAGTPSAMLAHALQSDAEGLAYRYALQALNPFVLVGPAALYERHNSHGELDLAADGEGSLTIEWLRDRADFLALSVEKSRRELPDDVVRIRTDNGAESILYKDFGLTGATANPLQVRLQGGNPLQQVDPIRVTFGGFGADELTGSRYGDRLYGGAGDDVLDGGEGNDILQGGLGDDRYVFAELGSDSGIDRIFDADGLGSIAIDGVVLSGGSRVSDFEYLTEDGQFRFLLQQDVDGDVSVLINDVLTIEHFHDGALGLQFGDATEEPPDDGFDFHYFGTEFPVDGPEDDPHFLAGSDGNDYYEWTAADPESFPDSGLIGGYFRGKTGDDQFLGGYWASDSAWGGPGDDVLDGSSVGVELGDPETGVPEGDFLQGSAGRDRLAGSAGDDRLFGDFESFFAGFLTADFDDRARATFGDAVLSSSGGPGSSAEPIHLRWSDDPVIDDTRYFVTIDAALQRGLGVVPGNIEGRYNDDVDGGAGNDEIVGGNGSDRLFGGAGDDVITGDYEPLLFGESGLLSFGDYAFYLGAPGDDVLEGGEGADVLRDLQGGSDKIIGGVGDDIIESRNRAPLAAFYETGIVPEDVTFLDVIDGGEGSDSITALSDLPADELRIWGGEGDDTIAAGAYRVSVDAGTGNDELNVGGEWLTVDAGADDDSVTIAGNSANVRLGDGNDTLTVDGIQSLFVSVAADGAGDLLDGEESLALHSIAAADVALSRWDDDLVLTDMLSGAEIVVSGWYESNAMRFDRIEFSDEVSWEPGDVNAWFAESAAPGTAGADIRVADDSLQWSAGLGGDDILTGIGEGVILAGGAGSDELRLRLGGDGLLIGGTGADTFDAGFSDAVIAFNRGDGTDIAHVFDATFSLGGIGIAEAGFDLGESGIRLALGGTDGVELLINLPDEDAEGELDVPDLRLQVISPRSADVYDLDRAFDDFVASGQSSWRPGISWSGYLLSSGADHAFGGDAAYTYALFGSSPEFEGQVDWSLLAGGALTSDQRFGNGGLLNEYVVYAGGGLQVFDPSSGVDTVRFGSGIDPGSLRLGLGSLRISVAGTNDSLEIPVFDPDHALSSSPVGQYRFADGTTLTHTQLLARGFDIAGTVGDDVIRGTNVVDRIDGAAGDDLLMGGLGSDRYAFAPGEGRDLVREAASIVDVDVVAIDEYADRVSASRNGGDIVLTLDDSGDQIGLEWYEDPAARIERVEFRGGEYWDAEEIERRANLPANTAPVLSVGVAATTTAGLPVSVANWFSFADADGDAPVSYEVRDNTLNGGHFAFLGQIRAAGESFVVPAGQLASLSFVGADAAAMDSVSFRATDGADFSEILALQVSTQPAPVVPGAGPDSTPTPASNAGSGVASNDFDPVASSGDGVGAGGGAPSHGAATAGLVSDEVVADNLQGRSEALADLVREWFADQASALGGAVDAAGELQAMIEAWGADPHSLQSASASRESQGVNPQDEPSHLRDLQPEATVTALDPWTITRALLEFHLEQSQGADSTVAPFGGGALPAGLLASGLSTEATGIPLPEFAAMAQQLRAFSGLREGFAVIGS